MQEHDYKEARTIEVGRGCLGGWPPQLARLEYRFIELSTLNLTLDGKEGGRCHS